MPRTRPRRVDYRAALSAPPPSALLSALHPAMPMIMSPTLSARAAISWPSAPAFPLSATAAHRNERHCFHQPVQGVRCLQLSNGCPRLEPLPFDLSAHPSCEWRLIRPHSRPARPGPHHPDPAESLRRPTACRSSTAGQAAGCCCPRHRRSKPKHRQQSAILALSLSVDDNH